MRKKGATIPGYSSLSEFEGTFGLVFYTDLRPSQQHELEDELLSYHGKFAANLR